MHIDAVIFDLDGTLANTLADIAAAMNHVLVDVGLSPFPQANYADWVGWGVRRLAEHVLPPHNQHLLDQIEEKFVARYSQNLIVETRPYPGVPELLDSLAGRGLPMGVLSNKPHAMTSQIIASVFGRWAFAAVFGHLPPIPKKPDPAGLLRLAAALGTPPSRCALVGDTAVDMEAARRAGMAPVGVAWGFRSAPQLEQHGAATVLAHPMDLIPWLDKRCP